MSLFGFRGDVAAWYDGPRRGVDRLSLAAWGSADGGGTPLFGGDRRNPVTVVVRWRTDPCGALLGPDGWSVLLWRLCTQAFRSLGELHDDFPLNRHDILVRGDAPHIGPCGEALLAARLAVDVRLRHAVDAAVRDLDRLSEVPDERAS